MAHKAEHKEKGKKMHHEEEMHHAKKSKPHKMHKKASHKGK